MKYQTKRLIFSLFASSLLGLLAPVAAFAAATQWHDTLGGKLRLISGGVDGARYKAGLEIVLDEGWKTYWKVPGDSGIPPILDGSASVNVSTIKVVWPVPSRIQIGASAILGYKDAIIFPIYVTPEKASQPTRLSIKAHLGLCSDLCVPLTADLSLDIPAGGLRDLGSELLIDRDLALVPQQATNQFRIERVEHTKQPNASDKLSIWARIPDGYGAKDLFVEGPKDWLLPLTTKQESTETGLSLFSLPLEGLPKGAVSKGTELHFTLTNGEEAVEQTIRLEK